MPARRSGRLFPPTKLMNQTIQTPEPYCVGGVWFISTIINEEIVCVQGSTQEAALKELEARVTSAPEDIPFDSVRANEFNHLHPLPHGIERDGS
jgi:hypothetical protein